MGEITTGINFERKGLSNNVEKTIRNIFHDSNLNGKTQFVVRYATLIVSETSEIVLSEVQ
jgi:hypothetical protein